MQRTEVEENDLIGLGELFEVQRKKKKLILAQKSHKKKLDADNDYEIDNKPYHAHYFENDKQTVQTDAKKHR